MPIVIPMHDAGDVSATQDITTLYSSLGGLYVIGASDKIPASIGALALSGETLSPALGLERLRGVRLDASRGSIDPGVIPDSECLGMIDAGHVPADPSYGLSEVSGEGAFPALAATLVGASPSLSGTFQYIALMSLALRTEKQWEAEGLLRVRNAKADPSRAAVAVRGVHDVSSRGVLEIGGETVLPVLASLDDGGALLTDSNAAVDAETGEAVDFVIDIQDEILASGHGDC